MLWDNSQSVGIGPFTDKVVPFLKQLIKNPQLNVGKDGTHLGFVTFSTEVKTRMLLDVGQIQDPDKLANWVDGLDYMKDLLGDGTRTGLGFKITSGVKIAHNNFINYISSVISYKYCNFFALQECDLSINRTHSP